MSIALVRVISKAEQDAVRELLDANQQYLRADISNYAKGRRRFWLHEEADLRQQSKGQVFKPAVQIPELWDYCRDLYAEAADAVGISSSYTADLGLVAYGDVGIDWHRDASYADYPAVSINISDQPTIWGYQECREGFVRGGRERSAAEVVASQQEFTLAPGALVIFNCKNPHKVVKCDRTRYSINLWCKKFK